MAVDRILDLLERVKYNIVNEKHDIEDIDRINEVMRLLITIQELFDGEPALNESPEAMAPLGGCQIYNSEVTIIVNSESGISTLIEEQNEKE